MNVDANGSGNPAGLFRARAAAQVVAVLARHLPPLVGVFAYGWSVGQFLVCAVFNTTWQIGVIAATNIVVSERLATRSMPDASQRARDLWRLAMIALVAALFLGALFGWITVVVATQGDSHTFDRALLIPLAMTISAGLVAVSTQYRADLAAQVAEATRKARDQPAIFALLASAAIIWFISAQFAQSGPHVAFALAIALTALFILRDLRPDFLRRILPLGGS